MNINYDLKVRCKQKRTLTIVNYNHKAFISTGHRGVGVTVQKLGFRVDGGGQNDRALVVSFILVNENE
jgi:hypothetical protein